MKYNEINQPNPSQPDTQNTGMAQNQLLKIGQHAVKIENMIADNQEISEWASNKINLASGYVKKIHNTLSEFDNPREKPQVRPVTTMDPKELGDRIEKAKAKAFKKPEQPDISQLWTKEKPATEDAMTSVDVDRVKGQRFSDKQIKMAFGVLNDPRFKGGNYTGAYNVINKIAPGLADHPSVANALRKANEAGYPDFEKSGRDRLMLHDKEIDQNSIEYEMQDASDMIFELHGAKFVDGTELNDQELEALEATDELQEWVRIDHATSGPDAPDESVQEDPIVSMDERYDVLEKWFQKKYNDYKQAVISDDGDIENNDELVELENILDAFKNGTMKDAVAAINDAKYEFSGIPGEDDDFLQIMDKLNIPRNTFWFSKKAGTFSEDESDEDKVKQWAEKYRQYKNLEDDNLVKALYDYAFDLGITQFIFEIGELQAAERELGKKQEDWEDTEINAALEMSPISDGLIDDLQKIIPGDDLEDTLEKIRPIIAGARGDESVQEDAQADELKRWWRNYSKYEGLNGDKLPFGWYMQLVQSGVPTDGMESGEARQAIADQNPKLDPNDAESLAGSAEEIPGVDFDKADAPITNAMKQELADLMGVDAVGEEEITKAMKMLGVTTGMESAVQEDAGLTDQQKQGLQAIYKKYGNYEGYGNGDSLPIGNMEQVIDPGSTLWADDKEYKELDAYMKKMGYDGFEDAQDKDEDFFDNAMKEMPISSAMQDDISKVLGNDYYEKPNLASAAKDYMSSSDESVSEDAGTMDWSTDKVKEFGDALIQLAKGQVPSDDLEIDDLEDGWAGADQDSRDQMAETIGARLMNVLVGYLQFSAGQKPSTDDVKDAQGVVNDPEFKKAYHSNESAVQEDAGLTDEQKQGLQAIAKKYKGREGGNGDLLPYGYLDAYADTGITTDGYDAEEMEAYSKKIGKESYTDWEDDDHSDFVDQSKITSAMIDDLEKVLGPQYQSDNNLLSSAREYMYNLEEDAGASPLKETARMAIELIEILKNGGNIDESTQNILNQAADNLHGVYNYESYAKTNPYREELDSNTLNKHAGVIQKGIDNILATETPIDDIDTKPGMLRILNKKVNEVEKELAKEVRENMTYEDMLQNRLDKSMQEYDTPEKKAERDALMQKYLNKGGKVEKVPTGKTAYKDKELKPAYRKDNGTPITSPGSDESKQNEGGMPSSVIKHKEKLAHMSDEELADRFKDFDEDKLRRMAWGHGYGKMSSHYLDRVKNHMTSKRTGTTEEMGPGFAVRYSLDGERKVQAYKTEKDAEHRAEILRSMGGVKDVSITTHTLNFKKESAYESKLATMLNQRLK